MQLFNQQLNNLFCFSQSQRFEQHNIINPVKKFRTETTAQITHHQLASPFLDSAVCSHAFKKMQGANIGGHDNHCIFKVDRSSVAIGDTAIVEDL